MFVILMLIFVLQTIWLYIKELAGKDLDIIVVAKFLFYFTPKLIPLVLPLTILLASIMVFGSFAENYEFAAMKSTGISLQRSMAGLSIFIVVLGITTFFFSNNVIPWAEINSYNLRKNIAKLKPAMAIAEGQFNEVMDYNIKVANKHGDRGQFLDSVVMHKKTGNGIGNYTTIISKTGELIGNEDSDVLKFILYDGYFYDDSPPKDPKERLRHPMTKSFFKKYTINIDLSGLNQGDLEEKNISDKYNMLNISDLNYTIDSLEIALDNEYSEFATSLYNRSNLPVLNVGVNTKKDTVFNGDVLSLFSNRKKVQLLDMAINATKSSMQIVEIKDKHFLDKSIWLNKHIIALHEKLALGFACIILFFVGAPLGALIRKGGIGLPMVIAILLFLTYHFIGIFAKNSAKDGSLNPVFAAWFSTLIMLPLGIYLTKRATADRGLFEFDHITEPLKKLVSSKIVKSKGDSETQSAELKLEPEVKKTFIALYRNYKSISRITIIFYGFGLISLILFFVFRNNKLPEFAEISIQLSVISWIVYVIYFFQERWAMSKILNLIQTKLFIQGVIPTLLSLVFYPVVYYFRRNKLKDVLPES
ncbi:LptF/LptG family permease [Hanstruepera flava]|uniref:LptF/LptG family permease n=1 Tax=Hanstruepera flava TaxID=2930218 RepID=UPI002028E3E8